MLWNQWRMGKGSGCAFELAASGWKMFWDAFKTLRNMGEKGEKGSKGWGHGGLV